MRDMVKGFNLSEKRFTVLEISTSKESKTIKSDYPFYNEKDVKKFVKLVKKITYNLVFEAQKDGQNSNISFDEVDRRINKLAGEKLK